MRSEVYMALLNLVEDAANGSKNADQYSRVIKQNIENNNKKDLTLSLKGYFAARGLSAILINAVNKEETQPFEKTEIKGPLGLGLELKATGVHIAFAAGTGILPYVDALAHMILRMVTLNGGPDFFEGIEEEHMVDVDNFKFILYTSFASEDEAIAFELVHALEKMCKICNKPDLFEHVSRISKQSKKAAPPKAPTGEINVSNTIDLSSREISRDQVQPLNQVAEG